MRATINFRKYFTLTQQIYLYYIYIYILFLKRFHAPSVILLQNRTRQSSILYSSQLCRIHVSDIFEKYISRMQVFKVFVALSFCSKFLLCSGFLLLALDRSGTAVPAGREQADL